MVYVVAKVMGNITRGQVRGTSLEGKVQLIYGPVDFPYTTVIDYDESRDEEIEVEEFTFAT